MPTFKPFEAVHLDPFVSSLLVLCRVLSEQCVCCARREGLYGIHTSNRVLFLFQASLDSANSIIFSRKYVSFVLILLKVVYFRAPQKSGCLAGGLLESPLRSGLTNRDVGRTFRGEGRGSCGHGRPAPVPACFSVQRSAPE